MSFESAIHATEHLIDDDTTQDRLNEILRIPEGMSTGYRPELRAAYGPDDEHVYGSTATPFPAELLIARSEWQARIQEMEERKTRLSDRVNLAGLLCKNQAQTNYCWGNAPVHTLEITRVKQNQEPVVLSPASVCAPIKGFRNVGGWGLEGLEWIVQNGVVPVDRWPANAIDRRYYTAENKQIALDYRVDEWWELRPRNVDELISCLLRRIPIAVGLNWWRHEVTYYDPVWVNGAVGVRFRNSWGMDWPNPGAAGYSVVQGAKMLPDDAVAPCTALAT